MDDDEGYIRELIEIVLFTEPGEWVNHPDFGIGLNEYVFMPSTPETMDALESTVQGALNRWLANVIRVDDVQAAAEESAIGVTIRYVVRRSGQCKCDEFSLHFK